MEGFGVAQRLVQIMHYKERIGVPAPRGRSFPSHAPPFARAPELGKSSRPDVVARGRHFRNGKTPSVRTSPLHPP